jgi:hypothetical protein
MKEKIEDKEFEFYKEYDDDAKVINLIWTCRITDRERLKHPFVGMCGWMYTNKDPKKKVHPQYQFCIHAVANDMVIVRFYSWLDGCPTNMEAYPLDEIKKWDLFTNHKDMTESYKIDFPRGWNK